jgi:hypothetical protein
MENQNEPVITTNQPGIRSGKENGVLDTVAKVISVLFHPVFMPLLGFWLMFSAETEIRDLTDPRVLQGIYLLLMVLIAAPVLSTLVLYSFRFIRSMDLQNPKERLSPFLTTFLFYAMAYYMLAKGKAYIHPVVFSAFSGALSCMALGLLITLRYKISMHAMSVAGVAGMLYALTDVVFYRHHEVIAVVMAAIGVVGAARVIRKVHSVDQVFLGALAGFVFQYLFVRYGWSF